MDPISALIQVLTNDTAVSTRVGTKVYGAELPRENTGAMPEPCLVLRPAGGGLYGHGYQELADNRIDIDCYGPSLEASWALHLDVREALKQMRPQVQAGTYLHWVRISSDGISLRDRETTWPMTFASYQVLASTTPIEA